MNLKFNKNQAANYLMIGTLVLLFAAKFLQINALLYPAFVFAAAAICVGDNNFRCGFCLMLVPNIRIFDKTSIGFLVNVLLALPVLAYIFESKRINFTALSHITMLGIWDVVHDVVFSVGFKTMAANLGSILVLYYVESVLTNPKVSLSFPDIARKFSFGCVFSATLLFLTIVRMSSVSAAWEEISTWRLSGFAGDPNYFSLYLCVAISMLLIISQNYKKRDYFYIFSMIGMTLLTYSKMSLGILILIFFYFTARSLYSLMSRKNRFVRRVMMISLGLGALFSSQIAGLIQTTLDRFQGHNSDVVDINTITSKRLQILQFYSGELISNPLLSLFGYGLEYNQTAEYSRFYYVVHNTFMDLILSWGIVGVLLFTVIFYQMITMMNRHRRERLTFNHFLPMIITFITFFALSCLSASMFWWIMFTALLPLKGLRSNETTSDFGNRAGIQRRRIHISMR